MTQKKTTLQVRHYRKYPNRKFYDDERGQYVSVREIAAVVKRGSDVEVTCDRTGRDLTLEVLARILYEEVRARGLAARYYDRGGKATFPVTVADVSRLIRSFAG